MLYDLIVHFNSTKTNATRTLVCFDWIGDKETDGTDFNDALKIETFEKMRKCTNQQKMLSNQSYKCGLQKLGLYVVLSRSNTSKVESQIEPQRRNNFFIVWKPLLFIKMDAFIDIRNLKNCISSFAAEDSLKNRRRLCS